MTTPQITVFAILLCLFGLLAWGRWRYDVVAFLALMAAVVSGVVPAGQAFSGFGHPATITVAAILILKSRKLARQKASMLFDLLPTDVADSYGFVAEVSAGTYIRSLARDLLKPLQSGLPQSYLFVMVVGVLAVVGYMVR